MDKWLRSWLGAAALGSLLTCPALASPNLVANGSFEVAGSWTSRSGGANIERSSSPGTYGIPAAPAGSFFVEVEYFGLSPNTLNDWIEQTIPTVSGERYITSIRATTRSGSNTADRMIFYGNANLSTVTTTNAWVNYSDSFAAAGATSVIRYLAGGSATGAIQPGDSVGLMVDDAQVQELTVSPASLAVAEDGAVTSTAFQVATNATDATLSVSFSSANGNTTLLSTTGLTFTGGANGSTAFTVSGTPAALNTAFAAGVRYAPVADYNGSAALNYTVTAASGSDTDAVPVSVSAVADIVNDSITAVDNVAYAFNAITGTNGGSADNFEGAPQVTAVSVPAHGAASFLPDGTLTYTANADYTGPDSFTYTVTSGGVTETATVSVTVQSRPRITLTKISNGATGSFTFTGNNGWPSQTIATTAAGGAGTAAAAQKLALPAVPTTLQETAQTGWKLSAVSCTGLGAGGTFTPNLAARTIAFDAAAVAANASIACTITNERMDLSIGKAVSAATVTAPGTLTYTLTVANTGSTGLSGVVLADTLLQGATAKPLTSGPSLTSGDSNGNGVLDTGESWVYSATYAVTQADIDNGAPFSNSATAQATNTSIKTSNTVTTAITQSPALSVLKTANKLGPLVVGDVVTFSYLVSNTGNVTVSGVAISEAAFNGAGGPGALAPSGGATTLAPGASTTFTASYAVTQADIDQLQP